MITALKERYAANKDNQKILKQAYDKGVERYLRDNNTTTTTTNGQNTTTKNTNGNNKVYRNPNSQEAKNEKETLNMARQRLAISQKRFAHDSGKWDKENILSNPYFQKFKWLTEMGKALNDSEGIQFTDDEIRRFYAKCQADNLFEKYIPSVKTDGYGNVKKWYTPAKDLKQMKEDLQKLISVSYENNQAFLDLDEAFNKGNFKTIIGL